MTEISPQLSSNCPTPFCKCTYPELPEVLGSNQMTAQIEKVTDSGMDTQKSLRMPCRFEPPHPSLPHPSRLVRLLCSIILVLLSTVDRIGNQLTMCDSMTTQLVGNDLTGFASMTAAYR
jgi:hypothetical protein